MTRRSSTMALLVLFIASLLTGCIAGASLSPAVVDRVGSWMFMEWLRPGVVPGWFFVWLRNMVATTAIVVLGLLPHHLDALRHTPPGLLVFAVLATNGLVPGILVGTLAATTGLNPAGLVLFGLLPHGILEIPVLVWACSVSLRPAAPDEPTGLWAALSRRLRGFVPVASVLLLCAAIIEETITPLLLSRMVLLL